MSHIHRLPSVTALKWFAVLGLAVVTSACAVNANSTAGISPDRFASAQTACRNVVGIAPSDLTFDRCAKSLADEPAGPEIFHPTPETSATHASYFTIPASVELYRREQACDSIGLHTGSDTFKTCVTDLDSALMYARNKN